MLFKRNDAVKINGFTNNGGTTNNHITDRGSDWYWTVTAIMSASTLAIWGLAFLKLRSLRIFHYITAGITLVAAVAYFTMASNLGWTPIEVEFHRSDNKVSGNLRQIFYVRYIDWFITTPLLLLSLLLTAGLPWPTIFYTILIDWVMIVSGLIGALVHTSYKWGFFAFGAVAFFFIAHTVVFEGRGYARVLGNDVLNTYTICSGWLIGLWLLYPIAWGVAEGGNVIAPDSEAIFYGVLDILAKPIFAALLLWGHRNIEPSRLGLHIRDFVETGGVGGPHLSSDPEKSAAPAGTNGHTGVVGATNGATGTTTGADTTTA